MRDSGCDVSYALRKEAIAEKRASFVNATENGFAVGSFEELIPQADVVCNLTPDKQHSNVVTTVMPLMKHGAVLSYSHGFNIVEEGMRVRQDLTVVMVAPKCPGTEVRNEYLRGFGVPTLIAVHPENDPNGDGLDIAKAYCAATGGDRAGVLQSSFVAEVKSDLMGEQTILCGMLQTGAVLCFDKMVAAGIEPGYASKLIQYGWETITEALKHGGITGMMNRLDNPSKIKAFDLAEALKDIMPEGQKAADAKAAACDEADAAKKELEMAVDAAEKEKSKDRRLADEGAADDAQEKSTDPVEAAQKAFDDAQKKCDEASEKAQKVYKSVEDAINTLRKETHVANETAEKADVSQTSEKFEFDSKGSLNAEKDEDADKPSPLGFAMYICGVMSLSVMGLGFVVIIARKLVVSRSRVTSVRLVAPQEEEPALE